MEQPDLFVDDPIADAWRAVWERRADYLRREWRKLDPHFSRPGSDAAMEDFVRASMPVGMRTR